MHTKAIVLLVLISFVAYCAAIEGNISEGHQEHVPTNHMAVELAPGVDPNEVAHAHGYVNLGPVGSLENIYLFHKDESTRTRGVEEHPHISESPHVQWFEKQVGKMRFKRFIVPTDPLFQNQWHLANGNGVDINARAAWELGVTGKNVLIAIVDDGLQRAHPDMANYNAEASYDFNENDNDPTPHYGDDHGTSAAGVAGAARNNVCGVGSAFEAGLSGIRLIADYTTDAQEAAGLSFRNDINFVYSNSWGPNDDGRRLEGPGSLTIRAFENTVNQGRNGKGSIYVWAGGNGRSAGDNCNYDGYANSKYTITIGAVDYMGKQSYYSESCAALIACAPSSGSSRSITTTDLLGSSGTSRSDCTATFGGTSAAAPLAAGVVALVLEANPNLGWRDVQQILVNTSSQNDHADSDWIVNGAGYYHNHKYGFGLVNAGAAVAAALAYTNLGQYLNVEKASTINLDLSQPVQNTIVVEEGIIVEAVEIVLSVTHPNRGDLTVTLTSPSGTKSTLQEPHNDHAANINWKYVTVRSWGEQSRGSWTVHVEDKHSNSVGIVNNWKLIINGH